MLDKIYNFIIKFLEDKGVDQLILCGHSHGNNYPIELLKRFISGSKYNDKLIYL